MKTAISLPDEVFEAAELLAAKQGVSRSRLYADALEAWVSEHHEQAIRERLDTVYREPESRSELDPVLHALQLEALGPEEW